MYVPNTGSELTFANVVVSGVVTMTAAEQASAFWNYLNSNEYLSAKKGSYAGRFGEVRPWLHRFDMKLLQDIFSNFGKDRKYTHTRGRRMAVF